MSGWND